MMFKWKLPFILYRMHFSGVFSVPRLVKHLTKQLGKCINSFKYHWIVGQLFKNLKSIKNSNLSHVGDKAADNYINTSV